MSKKDNTTEAPQAFDVNKVLYFSEREEKGLMRHLTIKQLDHGYVVEVGCKSFAVPSKEELCKYLIRYINNPVAMEKEYWEGEIFKKEAK